MTLLFGIVPAGSLPAAAASADLMVTNFTWNNGTEVLPGVSVTFCVTVKNDGDVAVTEPFEISFGTPTATFSTVSHTNSIAPGESVTIQSQPWTAVKGDYMVAVRVNATDSVTENDKTNNTRQANLRVAEDKYASAYTVTQKLIEDYRLNSLIFSEDFNDLSSVDTTNSGKEGYKWYVARAYGAGALTTDDYSVENGIMTVHTIKPTYNYGLDTYNCKTSVGFAYNKGYMEIRLRIPRSRKNQENEKGVPAIWALSVDKLENTADAWVEMDWMEYWGINGYDSTPMGFYTFPLHEQHLTGTEVTTHFKNSNYKCEGLGDGQWHVMGWLWQDGLFVAYLDGVEVMRQIYSASSQPTPSAYVMKSDGTVSKIGVYSMLDTQYNPIIIGGSKDNPMELDYVRVWNNSHIPATAAVDPTEQTAREFVSAYAMDADGKPIKTVAMENSSRVLAGENAWNALDETTKAAVNTLLQANDQPAYTQLLAQAKQLNKAPAQSETTAPVDEEVTAPSVEATIVPTSDGSEAALPTDSTAPLNNAIPENTPWTAIIIASVIVLLGGIALLWVCLRKKK